MFARICLILGTLGVLAALLMSNVGAGRYAFTIPVYAALAGYGGWRIYRRRHF